MELNITFDTINEPRLGMRCNKSLPPICSSRNNGKQHRHDWDGRMYHLKCYKHIQLIEECNRMYES